MCDSVLVPRELQQTVSLLFSNQQSSELEGPPPPDPPSYAATNIPLPDKHHMVIKHTMRDFIGLEQADVEARKAMMNFSYLSTIGNMDEAFKAIKLIKRYASNAFMSRIELKCCLISSSYLAGLLDIFIIITSYLYFGDFLPMRTLCDAYHKEFS